MFGLTEHNAIKDGGRVWLKLLKLGHLDKLCNLRLNGVWYLEVTQPGFVSNFCGRIFHIGLISKLLVDSGVPVDYGGDPAGRRLLL